MSREVRANLSVQDLVGVEAQNQMATHGLTSQKYMLTP